MVLPWLENCLQPLTPVEKAFVETFCSFTEINAAPSVSVQFSSNFDLWMSLSLPYLSMQMALTSCAPELLMAVEKPSTGLFLQQGIQSGLSADILCPRGQCTGEGEARGTEKSQTVRKGRKREVRPLGTFKSVVRAGTFELK